MVKAKSVVIDPVTSIGRLTCFQAWEQRPPRIPLSLGELSVAVFSGRCREMSDVEDPCVAAVWPATMTPDPISTGGPHPQTPQPGVGVGNLKFVPWR